jgi:hypothetical protein
MQKMLSLSPIAQLNSVMTNGDIVAFNVGSDGTVYAVLALNNTPDNFSGGWEESRPPYRVQMSLNKSH